MKTTREPTKTQELLALLLVGTVALTAVFAGELCVWIAQHGPVFWEVMK